MHSKQQYEVLVADVNAKYQWIRSSNGQVPHGAIQGGRTSRGEPLYIGRKTHARVMIPGNLRADFLLPMVAKSRNQSILNILRWDDWTTI